MRVMNPFHTAAPRVDEGSAAPVYPPREALNEIGRALLEDLQVRAILDVVVRDFPHVVNRISALWSQPAACNRLLGDLLLDDRLSRQGFPLAAISEISDLRSYYEERVVPVLHAGHLSGRRSQVSARGVPPAGLIERIGSKFRRS